MLEAVGLTRRFGWRWALRDVNLSVSRGRPLALLGANGSGKTTLLRSFAGLLRPTGGEVRIDGAPAGAAARGRVGLLTHQPLLYPSLTVRENLEFFGRLFDLPRPRARERIGALAARLGIARRLDDPVRALSQGLRQRAALARTLLHDPELVLLDEPFSGLDPEAAARLEETVRSLCAADRAGDAGGERIVVFTTHDLARARAMAADVAVLAEGRLVLHAAAEETAEAALAEALRRGAEDGGPDGGREPGA